MASGGDELSVPEGDDVTVGATPSLCIRESREYTRRPVGAMPSYAYERVKRIHTNKAT